MKKVYHGGGAPTGCLASSKFLVSTVLVLALLFFGTTEAKNDHHHGTNKNDVNFFSNVHEIFNPRALPSEAEAPEDSTDLVDIVVMFEGWQMPKAVALGRTEESDDNRNIFRKIIPIDVVKAVVESFEVDDDGNMTPTGDVQELDIEEFGDDDGSRSGSGSGSDSDTKSGRKSSSESESDTRSQRRKRRSGGGTRNLEDTLGPQELRDLLTVEELGEIANGPRLLFRVTLQVQAIWVPCWWAMFRLRLFVPLERDVAEWVQFPFLPYPRRCRRCYSYAGKVMAHHGHTIPNCGGRSCSCWDGKLTCEAKCKRRRAWHTLSSTDKQKHVDAINWLETQEDTPLGNYLGTATPRSYWSVLQDHLTYGGHAHGNSKFLPWHRCYLCEYEQMLQLYDVCVTVPFWYHPIDSGGAQYHVLNDAWLGDELAAYGQLNDPWDLPVAFSTFSRGGNNANPAIASALDVANLLSAASFGEYRFPAEGGLHHGGPHVYVGGNMGNFQSPADPLFWLHHGMVDRNWYVWRAMSAANAASYDNALGANVSPQWNVIVQDVIDETGLFAPSVTTYSGIGQLPTGDHCASCYWRVWVLIPWLVLSTALEPFVPPIIFEDEPLESVLARSIPSHLLRARAPQDSTIEAIKKANMNANGEVLSDEELAKIAREDCDSLKLPESLGWFARNFTMDMAPLRREICDRATYRIVEKPAPLLSPNRDVNVTAKSCSVLPIDPPERFDPSGASVGDEPPTGDDVSQFFLHLEPEVLATLHPCEGDAQSF